MKKIIKVPIIQNEILNDLALAYSKFEFLIYKSNHGIEYYLEVDNTLQNLLTSHGYVLEDKDVDLEGYVDCGGKIGYEFSRRDIVMNPFPLQIKLDELFEIIKGYPENVGIHIKIDFKNKLKEIYKRKILLLIQKKKVSDSIELNNYIHGTSYYEVKIRTNHIELRKQLMKHFNLVNNQFSILNDCTHYYHENEINIDLFPKLVNEENTPFVNLYDLFEDNISKEIITQTDKIILGKDKNNEYIGLTPNDLLLDVGIFGASGCGKGNLIFSILSQIYNKIPFFAIAPKGELPNLKMKYKNIKIYDPMVYCPLNIFVIPTNKTLREHLPLLKEIMVLILQLDEAPSAQALVQEAIRKTYYKFGYELSSGWNDGTPFSMRDFSLILKDSIKNSNYAKNEKGNILQILMNRISNCMELEQVFDDIHCIDFHQCLNENIIIDLKQTPPQMMALIMKIITILLINEIKQRPSIPNKIQNILLIDEAHNLFGNNDYYFDYQFSNDLYELRSLGCGFICSDQRMSKLESSILNNLTHLINGKLTMGDEKLIFRTSDVDERKTKLMTHLPTGTFVLQVKGTTLKNKIPILNPIVFTTENMIDDYLKTNCYEKVEYNFGSKLFSRCKNCKSNTHCHNQQRLRDISHYIRYQYDIDHLSKEEKIKVIAYEVNRLGIKNIELADAINCVNFLLAYKPN